MKRVSVLPAEAGWVVRSDAIANEQLFLSGRRAEAAGRRLVQALQAAGEPACLEVHLRDGGLATGTAPGPRSAAPAGGDAGLGEARP